MDQLIALFEEILVLKKADEPYCLFFNITTCGSDQSYVKEGYKDGPAKEIEPLNAILEDADFYEAISRF